MRLSVWLGAFLYGRVFGCVLLCSCLCGVVCFSVFVNVIVWWCLGGHRAFDAPALDHYLELCGGLCVGVFLIVCSNMHFLCFDACSHVFPGVSVCRCVSLYVSVGLDRVCCIIVRLVSSIVCAFLCSARSCMIARADDAGTWTCKNCGNINWPQRRVCFCCKVLARTSDPTCRLV